MMDPCEKPDNVSVIAISPWNGVPTSDGTFEKDSPTNASNVTASVSLNETISFGMMLSMLDDTICRPDSTVEALDQDSPITSKTSRCWTASSVSGVTSLIWRISVAPSVQLASVKRVCRTKRVLSDELWNCQSRVWIDACWLWPLHKTVYEGFYSPNESFILSRLFR